LWSAVVNTPQQKYVADPAKGSIHNFGLAVDLSLVDESGKEVDMGTPFDEFSELSEPATEARNLRLKRLEPRHVEQRQLLRTVMTEAGFIQLSSEWWHYDAVPSEQVFKSYRIIE
jgi:D-alanyl-D-alanine dipeptidase